MSKFTDEWGFFTQMPESVIKRTAELGSDAVFLFMYFRFRTNEERECAFPKYETMCKDIGWGQHRIRNAIRALEDAHLLERRKRYGKSTEYFLTKPPPVAVLDEETASIAVAAGLDEQLPPTSASIAAPTMSVLPEQQNVLKTESTQTELNDSGDKKSRPHDPLFDAICKVCRVDAKTAGASIGKVKQVLLKAGYTAEDVYAFGKWWNTDTWRRKNGPPSIWKLKERIGSVRMPPEETESVAPYFPEEAIVQ